jgi:hypothetical protein
VRCYEWTGQKRLARTFLTKEDVVLEEEKNQPNSNIKTNSYITVHGESLLRKRIEKPGGCKIR